MLLRQNQPNIIWNPQKQHFFPVRYIIAVNSPILGGESQDFEPCLPLSRIEVEISRFQRF